MARRSRVLGSVNQEQPFRLSVSIETEQAALEIVLLGDASTNKRHLGTERPSIRERLFLRELFAGRFGACKSVLGFSHWGLRVGGRG